MTPRDPGLQEERTFLAWNRTALAMAVNACLMLRAGMQPGLHKMLIPGVVLGGLALALLVVGRMRRSQVAGRRETAVPAVLLLATCAAVMLSVILALCSMLA